MKYILLCLSMCLLLAPVRAQNLQESPIEKRPTYASAVFTVDLNLAFGPSSTATFDYGLGVRWRVAPNFRIGFSDLSFAQADISSGTRSGISVGPSCEY